MKAMQQHFTRHARPNSGRAFFRSPGQLASCRSRQGVTNVTAFLGTGKARKAGQCLPSPFLAADSLECPIVLTDASKHHPSVWSNDMFREDKGAAAFTESLQRWSAAYSRKKVHSLQVFADGSSDVFIYFSTDLVNTGQFAGKAATGAHSTVAGLYRVSLDAEGRVSDVWLYRNGTAEEREHMLNHEAISSSSSHATTAEAPVQPPTLLPCTWVVGEEYTNRIKAAAEEWVGAVCSQASLQGLLKLVHPEVTLYDAMGSGPQGTLLHGAQAAGNWLLGRSLKYELSTCVTQAIVAEPGGNKVLIHWGQAVRPRAKHGHRGAWGSSSSHGHKMNMDGATLLVFSQEGLILQALNFHTPAEDQRAHWFKPLAAGALPVELPGGGGAAAGAAAGDAAAGVLSSSEAEAAEALKRQEMEWMSW